MSNTSFIIQHFADKVWPTTIFQPALIGKNLLNVDSTVSLTSHKPPFISIFNINYLLIGRKAYIVWWRGEVPALNSLHAVINL